MYISINKISLLKQILVRIMIKRISSRCHRALNFSLGTTLDNIVWTAKCSYLPEAISLARHQSFEDFTHKFCILGLVLPVSSFFDSHSSPFYAHYVHYTLCFVYNMQCVMISFGKTLFLFSLVNLWVRGVV